MTTYRCADCGAIERAQLCDDCPGPSTCAEHKPSRVLFIDDPLEPYATLPIDRSALDDATAWLRKNLRRRLAAHVTPIPLRFGYIDDKETTQ